MKRAGVNLIHDMKRVVEEKLISVIFLLQK